MWRQHPIRIPLNTATAAAPLVRAALARGGARHRRASRPRAGALRRRQPRAHQQPAQRWAPAVSGSWGRAQACVPVEVRRAPRKPAYRPGGHAARSRALSAPSTAVACGRPRRGAVAALVPRWSHGDDHLPGGRVTRALPPPAKGHGRGAWCKRWNRTAGGRWGPHLSGQPASRLHPHALVRAAFDSVDSDRHGLWVRHADIHAQSNTPAARGLTVRRSPSIGRAESAPRTRLEGDSRARGGRVDRSRRSSRPVQRASRPIGSGEWESFKGRLDSTRGPLARSSGRSGGSTRRGAAVHSARRGDRGGGRLAGASRPPPLSVPPPLPLQALPIFHPTP